MDLVFEAAPLASNFVVVVSVKQTGRRLLICAVAAIIVGNHTWRLEARSLVTLAKFCRLGWMSQKRFVQMWALPQPVRARHARIVFLEWVILQA